MSGNMVQIVPRGGVYRVHDIGPVEDGIVAFVDMPQGTRVLGISGSGSKGMFSLFTIEPIEKSEENTWTVFGAKDGTVIGRFSTFLGDFFGLAIFMSPTI